LETEPVVTGKLRYVRPDQVPAHERGQARRDLRLLRCKRLDCAAVEDLALDRTALEDPTFRQIELVEARCEQRLQRRWHGDLRLRFSRHRQHLADEERVAAGRSGDLGPPAAADLPRDERVDVVGRQRLEPERHRPVRAPIEQLGPGNARERDRCAG
jgi:hypothetical protein